MAPVLAFDLGTTGARAVLLAEDGATLASLYRPLGLHTPAPDRVEQDAREFVDAARDLIGAVLAEARVSAAAVDALGIVTQRGSAIAWDADTGAPLAPVQGWQDRRTATRVAELRALGIPINTLASCTKFEALLAEPAVRAAADRGTLRLGNPDAWLGWALSGGESFVTDPGSAGATGLYLPGGNDWVPELLDLFGVPRAALPEIVATDAEAGATTSELVGAAVPLRARAGDQQAACFAQGVRLAGDAKLTLGTAAMLDVCTGSEPSTVDGLYALPLWRLADGADAFCLEGSVNTAGAAIEWLLRLGLLDRAEDLDAVVGRAASTDVRFVPALAGLGSPFDREDVRASFTRLALDATRDDLVAAVVDGVAQRCADLLDATAPTAAVAVDGGLSRSMALLQRIADLSGCVLAPAVEPEATARGAAALAHGGLPPLEHGRVEPRLDPASRATLRSAWREAVAALLDGSG